MTRDDIIRMAQEADGHMNSHAGGIDIEWDGLLRFAALVAAAEREACAKVCDARTLKNERACDGADADETISLRSAAWQISVCAAEIRARGER